MGLFGYVVFYECYLLFVLKFFGFICLYNIIGGNKER